MIHTCPLIGSEQLSKALKGLPAWRCEQALRFRHEQGQRENVTAFLLLQRILNEQFSINNVPQFAYGEYGKPYFAELPHVHFSLSHCSQGVACTVEEHEVGVDIERVGRYNDALARHTMNEEELLLIENAENQQIAFTTLWTKKEALVKLLGTGIRTDMRTLLREYPDVIYTTQIADDESWVATKAEFRQAN